MPRGIGLAVKAVNPKAIAKDLNRIQRQIVPAATVTALNKASKKVRTDAKRQIASQVGLPAAVAASRIKIGKATKWRQSVPIYVKEKPIAAKTLGPVQNKAGVKTKKGKARQFNHAFMVGKLHNGVFQRKGKARYPIEPVKIPHFEVSNPIVRMMVGTIGRQTFKKEFERVVAYKLQKKLSR